jgi:hypothetical protein
MKSQRKQRGGVRGIKCPNVDTVDGVRLYLAWSLRKMIEGELPESKAKGGAYIAGMLLKAFELTEIENRIRNLEQLTRDKENELRPTS